jgi:SAM-dependent methyltransferase
MNDARIEDEQTKLWNGSAGHAWVESQALLDDMFKPFEELLVAAVAASSGRRVLDVGCGTGVTTLAAAEVLGPDGHALGVDISQPMIACARSRAERAGASATFVCDNAQTYAFEPASFDAVISRFGVMFFDDPVRAFGNLRRAASAGATLCTIAWRGPAENPFMTTAERTAAPMLPNAPMRRLDGPGQFAFADARRVRGILEESGWSELDIQPLDVSCSFPEHKLVHYLTRLGPLGVILADADAETQSRVSQAVRAAFEPYVHGAEVRFTAACWDIRARARG